MLDALKTELLTQVTAAADLEALEELRVAALGKKGRITGLMKELGGLSPDERRERGAALNRLKDEIALALDGRKAELAKAEREKLERQRELKAEREKAERDKAEKERLAKAKAEQEERERRQKADEARLAKLREENLQRILGQAGATGGPTATGTAARDAGPSASYAGRIVAAIRPNIVSINEFEGNPEAIVSVRAAPDGTILSRRLVRSSGDKGWDEEVLRAIDRTAKLPRDENGRVPPDIELKMRPKAAG